MITSMPAAQPRGQTLPVCPNTGHANRGVDRWELLSIVTDLRRQLDLRDRDIIVLRAHLSVLPHGLLNPDALNISFMSVAELLKRACGMDERRFRRAEVRLESAGLVRRRLSANGRRFPERDGTGAIVSAYGISLSPLLTRLEEFRQMQADQEHAQKAMRRRKNALSARLAAAMRAMAALAHPLPHWAIALRDELSKLVRRKAVSCEELVDVEQQIAMLEQDAHLRSSENAGPVEQEHQRETAVAREAVGRPKVDETPRRAPDETTADDGQTVRHIESKQKDLNNKPRPEINAQEIRRAWSKAEAIREFYPLHPNNHRDLLKILYEFSSFLGLRQEDLQRAANCLGIANTIAAVDYIARNIARLTNPTGYLNSMLKRYQSGETLAEGTIRRPATVSHWERVDLLP